MSVPLWVLLTGFLPKCHPSWSLIKLSYQQISHQGPHVWHLKKKPRGGQQISISRALRAGAGPARRSWKLPAACGQAPLWDDTQTGLYCSAIDIPRKLGGTQNALYLALHTIVRREHNVVIMQSVEGRAAAADPLRWREGTGGQGLRGTLASPRERVNVLLIWGQRCTLTLIHHHWQHQSEEAVLCHKVHTGARAKWFSQEPVVKV